MEFNKLVGLIKKCFNEKEEFQVGIRKLSTYLKRLISKRVGKALQKNIIVCLDIEMHYFMGLRVKEFLLRKQKKLSILFFGWKRIFAKKIIYEKFNPQHSAMTVMLVITSTPHSEPFSTIKKALITEFYLHKENSSG